MNNNIICVLTGEEREREGEREGGSETVSRVTL